MDDIRWGKDYIRCTCGMMVRMTVEAHQRTKSHQVAPRVIEQVRGGRDLMLVSRSVGMSREMVRRIALASGSYRETLRKSILMSDPIEPNLEGTLHERLAWAVMAAGFDLECRYAHGPGGRFRLLKRVFVGGHLCALGQNLYLKQDFSEKTRYYVRLSLRLPTDYAFYLGAMEEGDWIVVPREKMPRIMTTAAVGKGGRYYHFVGYWEQLKSVPESLMLVTA